MDIKDDIVPMSQTNDSEAVKVLRELVQCKHIDDRANALYFAGPLSDLGKGWRAEYDRLRADYIKRWSLAWEAANAVLAGESGATSKLSSIDCVACAVRNAQLEQSPNSDVPAEYMDWLLTRSKSEGVGGNEAWNAGVAWARANTSCT